MKKLLFFLFAICFIACEGPEGPRGYDGMDGRDGIDGKDGSGVKWFKKSYTIKPTDWILDGNTNELESFYYADIEINDLNNTVFQGGTVIAYLETDPGVKIGMPYVRHYGVPDEESYIGKYFWTETYDFDYTNGSIRFYLTYSDFNTETKPSENKTFHIVMMWE